MNPSNKKPGTSQIASKVDASTAEENATLAAKDATKAEKKSKRDDGKPKPMDIVKLEIPDADVLAYLHENRSGDAKLYCRLHRGTVVYVKYWERFLVWAGHHWQEDDNAFWQRVLLVKWPLSFVDDPQEPYERKADKGLDDKLKTEAKGVLARMVRGAMEYLRFGLGLAFGKRAGVRLAQVSQRHLRPCLCGWIKATLWPACPKSWHSGRNTTCPC